MSLDDIIKMNQQPGRGGRGGRRGRGRPFAFNRRNSNGEWRGVSRGGVRRRRDFRQPAPFTRVSWRGTTIIADLGYLLVLGTQLNKQQLTIENVIFSVGRTDTPHAMRLSSVWPINFQYHSQTAVKGYSCVWQHNSQWAGTAELPVLEPYLKNYGVTVNRIGQHRTEPKKWLVISLRRLLRVELEYGELINPIELQLTLALKSAWTSSIVHDYSVEAHAPGVQGKCWHKRAKYYSTSEACTNNQECPVRSGIVRCG